MKKHLNKLAPKMVSLIVVISAILSISQYQHQSQDRKPNLVIISNQVSLFTIYKNTDSKVIYYSSFGGFPEQIAFTLIARNAIPIPIVSAEIYSSNCTRMNGLGLSNYPIPISVLQNELNGKILTQSLPISFQLNTNDIINLKENKRCKAVLTIKTAEKDFHKKLKFINQSSNSVLLNLI